MLSYREPAYQGITEEIPGNGTRSVDYNAARRRPKTRNLKERLANIVSMYVPNSGGSSLESSPYKNQQMHSELVEEGDAEGTHDQFGLLSLNGLDSASSVDSARGLGLCQINVFLDKATMLSSIADSLQASAFKIEEDNQSISCMAVDNQLLYICLNDVPFLFKLSLNPLDYASSDAHSTPVTSINLCLPNSTEVIPRFLCLKETSEGKSEFYVIGDTKPSISGQIFNVLTCFSADGKCVAQTRKYDYQRYLAMDIDYDGNLLLACANAPEVSGGAPVAQICKLTPHFERRIFSITMRKGGTMYVPEWITKSSAGRHCWASVRRCDESAEAESSRRIFAFPGSQPDTTGVVRSPKEWLSVISWNFDAFSAGLLVALDRERLLAVDTDRRSLAIITWPSDKSSPSLQRITKPGDRSIDLLCCSPSTHCGDNSLLPTAFFASRGDIFRFTVNLPELMVLHEE